MPAATTALSVGLGSALRPQASLQYRRNVSRCQAFGARRAAAGEGNSDSDGPS